MNSCKLVGVVESRKKTSLIIFKLSSFRGWGVGGGGGWGGGSQLFVGCFLMGITNSMGSLSRGSRI